MTTLEKIRHCQPNVAIAVSWEHDPWFLWDGDMPDPESDPNNPLSPHNVTVSATVVRNGLLVRGSDHLGGCYAPLGGPYDEEIDGYLPQMIDDAILSLDLKLKEKY